ncbi:helix-turn-helix transcriptional regulator [Kribbella sp. NPDC023855]|uniref:helix-turn-helix transcriptional regulator n=1 Tax=Kribbella sp. NPDC023855 TaxID=3154698 RepID=UPI0033E1F02C
MSDQRRAELATFLRSRRERLTPEEVGLPRGRRRRTPGLRREEVSQLAAIGTTWYTWLEQGRDIQVSAEVLDAIARTLRLDQSEREHLFGLAGSIDPSPAAGYLPITAAIREHLDQLTPLPACVQSGRYDILAYNEPFSRLMCDLDAIPPEDRNVIWLGFTNDEWKSRMISVEQVQRLMAAKFRASMTEHLGDPSWKALLSRLQAASPEFCEYWDRHDVLRAGSQMKTYRHPQYGLLQLTSTSLWLEPGPARPRMVTFTPDNEETREKLKLLAGSPLVTV